MMEPIKHATVIGDGGMGTLCAMLLAAHGTEVRLWGAFPEQIVDLIADRENRRFLPGHRLPDNILPTSHAAEACADASLIVSAVPCQFMRRVWTRIEGAAPRDVPIVSITKGIEIDTLRTPVAIIRDCLGDVPVACLSGPCIAPEVADKKPASVVVASEDDDLATMIQHAFVNDYFRVYTSRDVVGVELSGAVKNVIAIAAGISDGIEAGDNAKAALLTRGLVEITRLGMAVGASPDTFRGLAGVGDLFTTCVSKVGRNRTAGERIGRGASAEEAVAATASVIEGIPTTRAVMSLAQQYEVEMPIVAAVGTVLFENVSPADAIHALMTRRLRAETTW